MIKILKKILLIFIFTSFVFSAFPESTKIENLSKFTLKNGLQLYVAENHTVPLVYIEIAVRGGGIAQKKENAGLFHLYEHMMFKGNSKYKTQEEIQNAITNLGVTTWNGTTGTEYVNYFFTVPKAKLAEGLEFWKENLRLKKKLFFLKFRVIKMSSQKYYISLLQKKCFLRNLGQEILEERLTL